MRTSPYEHGAGAAGSGGVFHRWSRRSGLTMACAGKLFDGMALKRHKYTKVFLFLAAVNRTVHMCSYKSLLDASGIKNAEFSSADWC